MLGRRAQTDERSLTVLNKQAGDRAHGYTLERADCSTCVTVLSASFVYCGLCWRMSKFVIFGAGNVFRV